MRLAMQTALRSGGFMSVSIIINIAVSLGLLPSSSALSRCQIVYNCTHGIITAYICQPTSP